MIILYGSETGTAQDVAERIWRESKLLGIDSSIKAMDDYVISELIYEKVAVFVVSTTGQGDTPLNMKNAWKFLLRKTLPNNSLMNLNFGVLGLGDSSFVYFNVVAKKLSKRLESLSAKALVSVGLADDQHDLGQDAVVDPWIQNLWMSLNRNNSNDISNKLILRWKADLSQNSHPVDINFASEKEKYEVKLVSNKRTTPEEHFQDVRLLKFKCEKGFRYNPGDVAIILPQNSDKVVDNFLTLLSSEDRKEKLYGDTIIQLENVYPEMPVPEALRRPFTLYECSKKFWDLNATPRRYMFQVMSHVTNNELEKEKLVEFCTAEGQEELYSYCHRLKRTVVEVLSDFPHVMSEITLSHLFEMLLPIRPRHFSIASSPVENDLKLLVAVVRYKTKLVVPRIGLCSTWLASLSEGHEMKIAIRKGSMSFPLDSSPVVMVGPGTGIAPFRSYALSEVAFKSDRDLIIFFGCRNMNADFHFKEDLNCNEIKLFTAFSRDQPHKIYVQHLIEKESELIYDLIYKQKAHFYVAGSANDMPKAVKEAVIKCLKKEGGMSDEEAEKYISEMERTKRYQSETWS